MESLTLLQHIETLDWWCRLTPYIFVILLLCLGVGYFTAHIWGKFGAGGKTGTNVSAKFPAGSSTTSSSPLKVTGPSKPPAEKKPLLSRARQQKVDPLGEVMVRKIDPKNVEKVFGKDGFGKDGAARKEKDPKTGLFLSSDSLLETGDSSVEEAAKRGVPVKLGEVRFFPMRCGGPPASVGKMFQHCVFRHDIF